MNHMKQLPVALTKKQKEFLDRESKNRGVTKASILRNLLADYMEGKNELGEVPKS